MGCEASNPKLFGAISIRAITIAIEARNVAVLAMSLTGPVLSNSIRKENVSRNAGFHGTQLMYR